MRARRREVADEIADVLLYLTRLADVLDIDAVAAARRKMRINARKYPGPSRERQRAQIQRALNRRRRFPPIGQTGNFCSTIRARLNSGRFSRA